MIRSELVLSIAEQNPHLYLKDIEANVSVVLNTMAAALADGDRVELRGFGTLSTREKKARTGRNPQSGAAVEVPARRSIHSKAGKPMQTRLNRVRAEPGPTGGGPDRA